MTRMETGTGTGDTGTGLCGEEAHGAAVLHNPDGQAPLVLACEHASNFIPPGLDNLGLSPGALLEHIAWDIGAAPVAAHLSAALDAPLVVSAVSRLVYDCNRAPGAPSAIPGESGGHVIPGNLGLSPRQRQERETMCYRPFHDLLSGVLARQRDRRGGRIALVTIHSFTPVWDGRQREVRLGILHREDTRLADRLLAACRLHCSLPVERNRPYSAMGDPAVSHTLVRHACGAGGHDTRSVAIEIRNDLIRDHEGQVFISRMLATCLGHALSQAGKETSGEEAGAPG